MTIPGVRNRIAPKKEMVSSVNNLFFKVGWSSL